MLPGVKQIDDLDGAREMLVGNVPNPLRSIAHENLLFGAGPTAPPRFQVDALAKLFGRFNRADIGGRVRVADGIAFLVPSRLREGTAQLGLPRVGWLPFGLTLPT